MQTIEISVRINRTKMDIKLESFHDLILTNENDVFE
jgi:hypothetical protein